MRFFYSLLFYLAMPFVLLHLAIRGVRDSAYLHGWNQRFCWSVVGIPHHGIIIHAASVGELNAAEPLIRAILASRPTTPVTITSFTPTGLSRAQTLFGSAVSSCFVPFDLPGAVRRFLNLSQPVMLIVMETELWPNLFRQAARRGVPVVLANARVSDKSLIGYRRFSRLTRTTVSQLTKVAAQSPSDVQKLVSLGVAPDRIFCSGNLKFDIRVPAGSEEKAAGLRQAWGAHRPVLVAASTHAEDDVIVLEAFSQVLDALPDALLILVPRHPERFDAATILAKAIGLRTSRFSSLPASSEHHQCHVLDAMGELLGYYAACDLAFVGGSFGTTGGHNPLEAAAQGKPVLFGPNMQNFSEISRLIKAAGAAIEVRDENALAATVISLMRDTPRRLEMGRAGHKLVTDNQGAVRRTLEAIDSALEERPLVEQAAG